MIGKENEYLTSKKQPHGKICGNCTYGVYDIYNEPCTMNAEEIAWHCRKYAPRKLSGSGMGYDNQLWSRVMEHWWCGEWEERA